MPGKKVSGALAAKLGKKLASAIDSHKDDEIKVSSGGDLPRNVRGIARLTEFKFGTYEKGDNKGEFFAYAAGVVVDPEEYKGCRTQFGPEPLCDTKARSGNETSLDDHVDRVLNEMRKLGYDTTDLTAADLESAAASLKEDKPYFRFRTWASQVTKQYPNPRINHDWRGRVDYEEDESADGVEDNTGDDDEAEDAEEGDADATLSTAELKALGKAADKGDTDAAEKLSEVATEHDIDSDEIENWVGVAAAIIEATEDSDAEDSDDSENGEAEPPKKGEVYLYKAKGAKKKVEVEVVAVFDGKETCNVKNNVDKKTLYKGVPWSELEEDEG